MKYFYMKYFFVEIFFCEILFYEIFFYMKWLLLFLHVGRDLVERGEAVSWREEIFTSGTHDLQLPEDRARLERPAGPQVRSADRYDNIIFFIIYSFLSFHLFIFSSFHLFIFLCFIFLCFYVLTTHITSLSVN